MALYTHAPYPPGHYNIFAQQKISFNDEMKQYENRSRLKGWVQKIFLTWPPNFIKDLNKSWLEFCPFCMNESEQIKVMGSFMLKKSFFYQPYKVRKY
jgi:hypothetical protein